MDPRQLYVDERLKGGCAYCGDQPDTRDHVPSKVFLDDPLPQDLPVVEACSTCNQGFSLDEEYLACFLECVLCGTAEPEGVRREKVKRALERNPLLLDRLRSSRHTADDGALIWIPEAARVQKVIIKLARGHAAYELSLPQLEEPDEVAFLPFIAMSESERAAFENGDAGGRSGWPEIGSRAFLRAVGAPPYADQSGPWVVVQPNRYRYSVNQDGGVTVRIALGEYLAGSVTWTA
jgi:hypothetical protein